MGVVARVTAAGVVAQCEGMVKATEWLAVAGPAWRQWAPETHEEFRAWDAEGAFDDEELVAVGMWGGPEGPGYFSPKWRRRRERASSSLYSRQDCGDRELLTLCRITLVQRRKDDPRRARVIAVPCDRKDCRYCGPVYRLRKVRHYVERLANETLYSFTVADGEWSAAYKRIAKRRGRYVKVPLADGMCRVLTSAPIGEPVDDVAEAVTALFNDMAVDGGRSGRRVTASVAWRQTEADETAEVTETEWSTAFETPCTVSEVRAVLDTLEIPCERVGRVVAFDLPNGRIPVALAEALELRRPRRARRVTRRTLDSLGVAA